MIEQTPVSSDHLSQVPPQSIHVLVIFLQRLTVYRDHDLTEQKPVSSDHLSQVPPQSIHVLFTFLQRLPVYKNHDLTEQKPVNSDHLSQVPPQSIHVLFTCLQRPPVYSDHDVTVPMAVSVDKDHCIRSGIVHGIGQLDRHFHIPYLSPKSFIIVIRLTLSLIPGTK